VKPENLLMGNALIVNSQVRLCDFGFAKRFAIGEKATQEVGTAFYAAPEIHLRQGHNQAADMWALGVTTYEILSGEAPWAPSGDEMVNAIITCDYEFDSDVWDNISEQAKDLIRGLITREPDNRLTVDDALSHPWFDSLPDTKFAGTTVNALGITGDLLGMVADDVLCGEDVDQFDGF
jgi:serine/threonine protein kinase